ncbi:sensor histidine kinase [Gulosibacter chungangensis]|uniref:Sensor-like histidine kinase SenX3 n=1 Tax=Gulosibacter chungangensis TaxID=979746 RepID=A0A7J5BAI0_9MICO|nr:ATP-binding protein [Gulosibacter chungangensis]KAB1643092.1 two-component sensor histidine kinase [Gulosibacter chungangensis]
MSTAGAIYASVGLGIVVGLVIAAVVYVIVRARSQAAALAQPVISADVEEVLAALPQTAIVSDPSHQVIRSSFGATKAGLVTRNGRLAPILVPVASKAWESEQPVEATKIVPRGRYGSAGVQYRIRSTQLAPRFILTLAQDITESIRVEEVRRDFVANVSHELKTPIGAVTLLAEAVQEAADDTEQVRYFAGRMLVETDRLARLTRELIDLSRLQAMDTLENAAVVDMAEVVEQAIDLTRVPAEAKGIRVRAKTAPDAKVWGDDSFLLMCVQNLITNAITYSPENSSVGLGMRKTEDVLEISVADQGIGISDADQQRIFERFYRVDAARSRNTGGTGLGLSIVRHIVENHGGEIRVWSKPEEGSTFTIRIPLIDSLREEPVRYEAEQTSPIQLPKFSPDRD